jgi:hypothetical protein
VTGPKTVSPSVHHRLHHFRFRTQNFKGLAFVAQSVLPYRKSNQKQVHPRVINSSSLPVTLESSSSWLIGRCSRQLRKSCAGANVVYSEALFILENYFASKSFASLPEAFSNTYPDREVLNKIRIHRLVTKFRGTGSACLWQVLIEQLKLRPFQFQAVHQLQQLQEFNRRLSQSCGSSLRVPLT